MKVRGRRHGTDASMTVYFSLVFAVMTSLICASILSVKVSAGRMQAANAVDQALFSLFARYDRELAEKFDLFFIHAGNGGTGPDLNAVLKELGDSAEYILDPGKGSLLFGGKNFLSLEIAECALLGCTLATDGGGAPFAAQAVDSVRDTVILQGFGQLRDKVREGEAYNARGREAAEEAKRVSWSDVEKQAEKAREEERERMLEAAEAGQLHLPERPKAPAGFKNPIPALWRLRHKSLMQLVVPGDRGISKQKTGRSELVSGRGLASGFGVINTAGGTAKGASGLAFKSYISSHFSTYTEPSANSVLWYQTEYILCGENSDEANLKKVVKRLMLMREAANLTFLYTNPEKTAELSETALVIGTLLLIPEAEPLIKLILAAFWAYAESLVDVRALLSGMRVPYVKDAASWQTALPALASSGGDISQLPKDSPGGMDYREYLGALLVLSGRGNLIMRSMDMVESEIRGAGRPSFRLDACISALETHIAVRSENRVTFPVEMKLDYREL